MNLFFCPDPKPIRIKLKGKAYTELKRKVYYRDKGRCQGPSKIPEKKKCYKWLPLTENGVFNEFTCAHLSHIKSRGSGGDDTEENTEILCFNCHRAYEDGKWKHK